VIPLGRDEKELGHELPAKPAEAKRLGSRDRITALERELMQLRREVGLLRGLVGELDRKVSAAATHEEFVEYRGALFRRKITGGFHEEVFCPSCREPMRSPQNELNFNCRSCQTWVNIKGHELPEVMDKLRRFDR
jgi:hypothetical protein